MPRMIEDTTQPPEQPIQASEKAFEIVWCGETYDNVDFADVVEKAQTDEDCQIKAFDILARFSNTGRNDSIEVRKLRKEFNDMLGEVAVKMLEDK